MNGDGQAADAARRTALVVGASGGVGGALLERLSARGWRVHATGRRPPLPAESAAEPAGAAPVWHRLDVTDEATVRALADTLEASGESLDLLVNCAGMLHDGARLHPERRLEDLDPEHLARAFAVHAIGLALILKHLLPRMRRGRATVLASLSARVGSIGDNRLGGWYAYRASKAAHNMLLKGAAIEAGRRHRQVILVALHPGTVDSDLSRPFQRGVPAEKLFTPATAAAHLLAVIDRLGPADSGKFLAWDGREIPW